MFKYPSQPYLCFRFLLVPFIAAALLFVAVQWSSAQEPSPVSTPQPVDQLESLPGGIIADEYGTGSPSAASLDVEPDTSMVQMAQETLDLVNAHRLEAGCPALVMHTVLNDVALSHSREMAEYDYFSHTNLEGLSPGKRATAAGYRWGRFAENIAAGFSTSFGAVQGWMASEGHRKNILNCVYNETGIGIWYDPEATYGYYWTQDFAVSLPNDNNTPVPTPVPTQAPEITETPEPTPTVEATPSPTATQVQVNPTPAQVPDEYKVRLPFIGN